MLPSPLWGRMPGPGRWAGSAACLASSEVGWAGSGDRGEERFAGVLLEGKFGESGSFLRRLSLRTLVSIRSAKEGAAFKPH
jgi:hypothetical protein